MRLDVTATSFSDSQLNIQDEKLVIPQLQTSLETSVISAVHSYLILEEESQESGTTNNYNTNNGYGLINAGNAVSMAIGLPIS